MISSRKVFISFLTAAILLAYQWQMIGDAEAAEFSFAAMPAFYNVTAKRQYGRRFDRSSTSAYAINFETLYDHGISFGADILIFNHEYRIGTSEHKAESSMLSFTTKQYFNLNGHFRPFFGIGAGFLSVDTDEIDVSLFGLVYKSFSGDAFKFTSGFVYTWGLAGIHLEYVNMYAQPEDDDDKLKMSGWGLMSGIRFAFGAP